MTSANPARRPATLRWFSLALILTLFFVDGIDTQLLAVAVPSMALDWGLPPAAFALALAMGHAGAAVGATAGGLMGDRFGRRNAIVACALLFGFMSMAVTFVHGLAWLVALRLACGFGLGGTVPPAVALLSELFDARHHGSVIALAFLCAPFGIATVGLLAAAILPVHGWALLFWIAGIAPACVGLLLLGFLPAAAGGVLSSPSAAETPIRAATRAWRTLMDAVAQDRSKRWPGGAAGLCGGFFFAYAAMAIVLTWLPSLLYGHGFSVPRAATAVSIWSFSGMAGIPLVGWAGGRLGTRRVATWLAAAGGVGAVLIAVALTRTSPQPGPNLLFYTLLSFTGVMANGLVILLYSLAATEFPPSARATGVGLASTSGRTGAIVCAYWGGRITELAGVGGFFAVTAVLFVASLLSFNFGRWRTVPEEN